MKLTSLQKTVLLAARMAKVNFRSMWQSKHELGYASKGNQYAYDINVASDAPSIEVRNIVLIHEAGHIYLRHTEVELKDEMKEIDELLHKHNKTAYQLSMCYGGPMNFLNICMDLEINSKILTVSNVREMKKYFEICTPEGYGVEIKNNFREYYEPLIERMSNTTEMTKPDMQDLPQIVLDSLDDLSEEFQDAVSSETYYPGNMKASSKNVVKESTVGEEQKVLDTASGLSSGYSTAGTSNISIEVKPNTDKTIRAFLNKIINTDMNHKQDAMRHYNRGSRDRSSGLLYNSTRLSRDWSNRKKIAFLVDVSGSMYVDSITKAVSSLKDCQNMLTPDSSLVAWDTQLSEEYTINKIPQYIKTGGGTDIAAGLRYLDTKGFTDIVIYSDFETNIPDLQKALNETKANVYSIIVMNGLDSARYIEEHKKTIFNKTPYIIVK